MPRRFSARFFAPYAWLVLAYTQLVILWGTYVRAAGAGNGCGPNWPLCDGQFLPHAPKLKMFIEFFHRVSSGLDGVLILGLWAGAMWLYPRRHRVRRAATAALVFVGIESLLGAALVLFRWVGSNASPARVTADALHLINTMLLLAAVLVTALWASGLGPARWRERGRGGPRRVGLGVGVAAVLVTAVCGVMAALADTLYPAVSLAAGFRLDFSHAAPVLERLRVLHPLVAITAGLVLMAIVMAGWGVPRRLPVLGYLVIAAVGLQWAAGAADIALLTPIPVQILHLLGADLVWLAFVAYAADELAGPNVPHALAPPAAQTERGPASVVA